MSIGKCDEKPPPKLQVYTGSRNERRDYYRNLRSLCSFLIGGGQLQTRVLGAVCLCDYKQCSQPRLVIPNQAQRAR